MPSLFAQWYLVPKPSARKKLNMVHFSIIEPTNNVPPKKDGEKFKGWKEVFVTSNGTSWMTCQVSGYPVPKYT